MSENGEKFLARWSRVKREEAAAPSAVQPKADPPAVDPDAPPPELPPLDKLTIDSDYTGFFHPKVDEKLRQAALRKLFADPHFNVMDGLDVYIDDYSKSDPLPAEMLAQLKQGQRILAWAREDTEKTAAEAAAAEAGKQASLTDAPPAPPSAVIAEPVIETVDQTHTGEPHAIPNRRES